MNHTNRTKSQRDRNQRIFLTCGIKKNDKNELIYKTETDSNIEYKFMNTQRERGEGQIRNLGLTDSHHYK